jgi:hypothetical protein
MKRVFNAISSIGSYCPYTLVFKKALRVLRGERIINKSNLNDRERDLLFRLKLGKSIALVGFLCPTFWIPLFSGVRGGELYILAGHSGLVVLIGFGFILKYRIDLEKESRNQNEKNDLKAR